MIARRQTMTKVQYGDDVLSIDLTDTHAGLQAVLECQDKQG